MAQGFSGNIYMKHARKMMFIQLDPAAAAAAACHVLNLDKQSLYVLIYCMHTYVTDIRRLSALCMHYAQSRRSAQYMYCTYCK